MHEYFRFNLYFCHVLIVVIILFMKIKHDFLDSESQE